MIPAGNTDPQPPLLLADSDPAIIPLSNSTTALTDAQAVVTTEIPPVVVTSYDGVTQHPDLIATILREQGTDTAQLAPTPVAAAIIVNGPDAVLPGADSPEQAGYMNKNVRLPVKVCKDIDEAVDELAVKQSVHAYMVDKLTNHRLIANAQAIIADLQVDLDAANWKVADLTHELQQARLIGSQPALNSAAPVMAVGPSPDPTPANTPVNTDELLAKISKLETYLVQTETVLAQAKAKVDSQAQQLVTAQAEVTAANLANQQYDAFMEEVEAIILDICQVAADNGWHTKDFYVTCANALVAERLTTLTT